MWLRAFQFFFCRNAPRQGWKWGWLGMGGVPSPHSWTEGGLPSPMPGGSVSTNVAQTNELGEDGDVDSWHQRTFWLVINSWERFANKFRILQTGKTKQRPNYLHPATTISSPEGEAAIFQTHSFWGLPSHRQPNSYKKWSPLPKLIIFLQWFPPRLVQPPLLAALIAKTAAFFGRTKELLL